MAGQAENTEKTGIRHVAITDENEQIVGILSNRDILTAQGQSPVFLVREIATANSMEEIVDRHNKLPRQIRSLISSGANAKNLTRFITWRDGRCWRRGGSARSPRRTSPSTATVRTLR